LPKDISEALDSLFERDPDGSRGKVNKLRQAGWRCIERAVKRACLDAGLPAPGELGGVQIIHPWGSSSPWSPHWHLHAYIAPYTCDYSVYGDNWFKWTSTKPGSWRALPRWWSEGALEELRHSWKKASERILGIKYPGEWDVKRGYFGKERQMLHMIAYQLRAPMSDIWKGVRGDVAIGFDYCAKGKRGHPGKVIPMTVDDFQTAYCRAEVARTWLVRVTWYGYLSKGKLKETMVSLDLVLEDEEDEEKAKHRYWNPIDVTSLGVLFSLASPDEDDRAFVEWAQLSPHPVPAPTEKPIGCSRRRRWVARARSP